MLVYGPGDLCEALLTHYARRDWVASSLPLGVVHVRLIDASLLAITPATGTSHARNAHGCRCRTDEEENVRAEVAPRFRKPLHVTNVPSRSTGVDLS